MVCRNVLSRHFYTGNWAELNMGFSLWAMRWILWDFSRKERRKKKHQEHYSTGYKLLCYWQDRVCGSHCNKCAHTPTERLVLNPLKSYEWRSNCKVNRPRRKINLENCLNSCRPVSLSLRDHTGGRGWDECLLVLREQVHIAYTMATEGVLVLCLFPQPLFVLLSDF